VVGKRIKNSLLNSNSIMAKGQDRKKEKKKPKKEKKKK